MSVVQVVLAVMGLAALVEFLVAVPLALGKVPRNPWYGLRTRKTLASDAVWYPANRYAGRALAAAALVSLAGLAVLGLLAGRVDEDTLALAGVALTAVPTLVACGASVRYASRL